MVTSQVMDIKAKNVACLKVLLSIAQTDGNYLGDAWYEVRINEWTTIDQIDEEIFFSLDLEMY